MTRHLSTIGIALVAFAAGLFAAHHEPRADAAPVPIVAQAVDLGALTYDALPPPGNGTLRKRMFVDADLMTLGIYMGPFPRHYHANSNEIQYVVDGTGTESFGERTIALKPGMLLVIPKGMVHGGVGANLKLLEIKTPPQDPDDNHRIP